MILDDIFPKKVLRREDKGIYMNRWYLWRNKLIGIFIHQFLQSDYEAANHDHPWDFIVIPIWRGYWEHIEEQHGPILVRWTRRVYPIIGTRFRRATFRHRVELLTGTFMGYTYEKPAWSIFIRFRRKRAWGFWCKTGFKPYQEDKSPCE